MGFGQTCRQFLISVASRSDQSAGAESELRDRRREQDLYPPVHSVKEKMIDPMLCPGLIFNFGRGFLTGSTYAQ